MPGRKKGFVPLNKTVWPDGYIDYIQANFSSITNVAMAKHLGVGLTVFRDECRNLGLKHLEMEYWTDDQVDFLRNNYQEMGDTEMAIIFNYVCPKQKPWSKKHHEKKRRYLKLKRTPEEILAINKRNVELGMYADCAVKRWKLSHITPLGEVKIWQHQQGKILRQYKVIKTETGFEHYMPWLYKQHFGEIPDGYVVSAKDGDNLNVVPENLELLTRAQIPKKYRGGIPVEFQDFNDALQLLNKQLKQKQHDKSETNR